MYSGIPWLEYNKQFHQKMAGTKGLSWDRKDIELWIQLMMQGEWSNRVRRTSTGVWLRKHWVAAAAFWGDITSGSREGSTFPPTHSSPPRDRAYAGCTMVGHADLIIPASAGMPVLCMGRDILRSDVGSGKGVTPSGCHEASILELVATPIDTVVLR